jgi:hypothetical protein
MAQDGNNRWPGPEEYNERVMNLVRSDRLKRVALAEQIQTPTSSFDVNGNSSSDANVSIPSTSSYCHEEPFNPRIMNLIRSDRLIRVALAEQIQTPTSSHDVNDNSNSDENVIPSTSSRHLHRGASQSVTGFAAMMTEGVHRPGNFEGGNFEGEGEGEILKLN